jgi:hypothetical protein
MRHDDREQGRQHEQRHPEVGGSFLQDVGRLRAGQRVHHAAAKRRSETFLPRTLHQHDQDEKNADDDLEKGEDPDEDIHGGREYGTGSSLGNRLMKLETIRALRGRKARGSETPRSKSQIPRKVQASRIKFKAQKQTCFGHIFQGCNL